MAAARDRHLAAIPEEEARRAKVIFLNYPNNPTAAEAPLDYLARTVALCRERGITVNAVQAGGARDTERVWREIAQMGHGRYIPIPQDGGHVLIIETPFDIEILELQDRITSSIVGAIEPDSEHRWRLAAPSTRFR